MPVGASDCRVFGAPRSPKARHLLQRLWEDRSVTKGSSIRHAADSSSFIVNAINFSSVFQTERKADDEYEAKADESFDSDFDFKRPHPDDFETSSLKNCHHAASSRPPLPRFHSLEGKERNTLLPLDLIQTSLIPGTTSQTLSAILPPFKAHGCKSYCSCRNNLPTNKTIPFGSKAQSSVKKAAKRPQPINAEEKARRSVASKWYCATRFLLCSFSGIFVLLLIFTQVARMIMVPITVFLTVLSLALFLFILFCVCFIIFI